MIAVRLLASARRDIEEGRPEVAERVLEILVARFPESDAARDARGLLVTLHGGDLTTVASGGDHRPSETLHQVSSWRTSIIGHRRHQDELRYSVGDRIFFSAGSADLGSRARALIAAQAAWLLRRPDLDVVVEGHADDAMIGVDNGQTSEIRARVVRDRLVAEGVPVDRVRISPQADRDRVAICGDSDCAAQNRRAVVLVGVRRDEGAGYSAAVSEASAGNGMQRR